MSAAPPRLLTVSQVAERLAVGRESARKVVLRHLVRYRVTDGSYRIPESAVDAYLSRRLEAPCEPTDLPAPVSTAAPGRRTGGRRSDGEGRSTAGSPPNASGRATPSNGLPLPAPGSRLILVHEPKPRGRRTRCVKP